MRGLSTSTMVTRTTTIRTITIMFGVLEQESKMFSFQNIYIAYMTCRKNKRNTSNQLTLREDTKLKKHTDGLDFLGYVIRPNYMLVRQRVVNNYKKKKALYLKEYEREKGKMSLAEIKVFLSLQASFASHCKHANSFNLLNKVGVLNETNSFDYDRY